MRRSMVILSTIVSLVLCMALIGFGVFANINQTYSVSNTIGFNPSEKVYVELDCKVMNCKQTEISVPPDGYASMEEYLEHKGYVKHIPFDESIRDQEDIQDIEDWEIQGDLEFVDHNTAILYVITIKNYSDREIEVSIEENVGTNENIKNKVPTPVKIPGYQRNSLPSSATITLETKVAQYDNSFTGENNNFVVVLKPATDD